MARAGLDGMIVENRPNTFYLSGFTGTASLILITARTTHFLTDFRYIERARRDIHGYRVVKAGNPASKTLAQLIVKRRLKTVGFEGTLSYDSLAEWRKQLREARPKRQRPVRLRRAAVVNDARAVKLPYEVSLLRKAQRAAESVFDCLLGDIEPGMTERDVRRRLLELIEDAQLDGPSFAPIIASGPNSAMPHAQPSHRRIARRDIVTIDMGVMREGYCSDMTRTVFFGAPTREMREVYGVVLEAQERALAAVRAGAAAKAVDAAARSFIRARKYGKAFGHGTGHGVGVEVHEAPTLNARSKAVLADGHCVTIEPGIYLEGRFGVRIEDTVIVREGGAENLMKASKSLVIL